jgi:conjugative transfer pilus assembly protein TraH
VPVPDANANLTAYVKNTIVGIAGAIQNKQPLTPDQISFIQSNPLSVLSVIKGAIRANNVDVIASNLAEPTAKAYAYRLMDDMYQRIWFMIQRAQLVASRAQAANDATAETCKYEVLKPQIDKMTAFGAAVEKTRQQLRESYITAIQEINSVYALVGRFEKVDEILNRDLSRRFGSSTANRAMNR